MKRANEGRTGTHIVAHPRGGAHGKVVLIR